MEILYKIITTFWDQLTLVDVILALIAGLFIKLWYKASQLYHREVEEHKDTLHKFNEISLRALESSNIINNTIKGLKDTIQLLVSVIKKDI